MAARTTMANLITYTRDLIADPAGASQVFSDDQIQQRLDDARAFVNYAVLRAEPTLAVNGILSWLDFYANIGYWEDAPVTQLYSPNFTVLSPATTDLITGHWQFTTPPPGQILPVYVRGYVYDPYAAASDLCRMWAAKVALSYDVASGTQRLSRSQMRAALLEMASEFARQSRPRTIPLVREDEDNHASWPLGNDSVAPWNWN